MSEEISKWIINFCNDNFKIKSCLAIYNCSLPFNEMKGKGLNDIKILDLEE